MSDCEFCTIIKGLMDCINVLNELPEVGDHYDSQVESAINKLDCALSGHTYTDSGRRCRACTNSIDVIMAEGIEAI